MHISEENDHFTYASSLMTLEEAKALEGVLQQNKDAFAWTTLDMPGIHLTIALHWLNVIPFVGPIRQKGRCFHSDRQRVIQIDVEKLLVAGFIKELEY